MRRAMFRWRVISRELRNFKPTQLRQYWNAVMSLLFPTVLDERTTIGAATYSVDTE